MEGGADGFALDDGEALFHPPPHNVLEMVVGQVLRVHAPMRVAQIEKRRSIGIHQVFRPFFGLDETMPVDVQRTVVLPTAERPIVPVQGRVVRAGALPGPAAGLRRGETDHEPVAAVPESGDGKRLSGLRVREQDVHPDPVPAPGVVTAGSREVQFAHPPGFGPFPTGKDRQRSGKYHQRPTHTVPDRR